VVSAGAVDGIGWQRLTSLLLLRAARVGKPKDWSRNIQAPAGLHEAVDALAGAKMKDALRVLTKGERRQALMLVDALVLSSLASQVRIWARWCGSLR